MPAIPADNLVVSFNLSTQSLILGRQYRWSRQSRAKPSAISADSQCRPVVSVAVSAVSDCKFSNLITLSNPGNLGIFWRQSPSQFQQSGSGIWAILTISAKLTTSAIMEISTISTSTAISGHTLGDFGSLVKDGNLVSLGNLGTLINPGKLGIFGHNLWSPGNPGRQSIQRFQSQHAISHSRPAISIILAISGDTLDNLANICIHGNPNNLVTLCKVGRQSPEQSAICDGKFSILIIPSNPDNLGSFGRQRLQSRQSRPVISSTFSISACNLPFSAGNIGNPGNLGRHFQRIGHPCQGRQYLYSRQSPLQFQQSRPANSAMRALSSTPTISAILGGNPCSPSNPGCQSRQFFQSWHAISHSRLAMLVISTISSDNLGDLGQQNRQSRHSQHPPKSLLSWPAISAVPEIPSGNLRRNVGNLGCKIGNVGFLSNPRNLGNRRRQSASQSRQYGTTNSAMTAL